MSDQPETTILLSELIEELGLDPAREKEYLTERLSKGLDWLRKGRGRSPVWLTREGESKLRIYAEVKDDAPHLAPKFEEFRIHSLLPNKRQVCLRVPDESSIYGYRKEPCVIPGNLQNFVAPGKLIRVECIPREDGSYIYRHESFAAYEKGRL